MKPSGGIICEIVFVWGSGLNTASAAENPYTACMGACLLKKDVLQYLVASFWDLCCEWDMLEHVREKNYNLECCLFTDLFEGSWGKSLPDIHRTMKESRLVGSLTRLSLSLPTCYLVDCLGPDLQLHSSSSAYLCGELCYRASTESSGRLSF